MLTSIIMPVHNLLPYTRQAVESIFAHTPEPFELIIVDNASTDGTAEYASSLTNTRYLRNEKNRGHPGGTNDGTRLSRGEVLVWLNNDVLVTENWLSNLLDCLESSPDIGLVSPLTNYIGNPGQLLPITFQSLAALEDFTRGFNRPDPSRHRDGMLFGFCLALPRRVWDLVGPLDESTGLGNGDDIDYVNRVQAAGLRTVVCGDTFLHHYGSRTFGLLAGNAAPPPNLG